MLDRDVAAMMSERARWGEAPIERSGMHLARVLQLREVEFALAYQEVEDVAEHVADSGGYPVRVKVFSGHRANDTGSPPALIRCHGGGFVMGSPEVEERESRAFANTLDCRVFAPAYRLAPEHTFPAALEDCLAVTRWVSDNAATLGVDKDRIALIGHSAGGWLALACVLACHGDVPLRRCVALEPMIAPGRVTGSREEYGEGHLLSSELVERFWSLYLDSDAAAFLPDDPLRLKGRDVGDLCPISVFTSECDPLRDEAEDYARELAGAGVDIEQERFAGLVHGAIAYGGRVPAARGVFEASVSSLRRSWS